MTSVLASGEEMLPKAFVGEYEPEKYLLNEKEAVSMGPYDIANYYMEHKYQQKVALDNAKKVIYDVAAEFEALSGRKYGMIEEYMRQMTRIMIPTRIIIRMTQAPLDTLFSPRRCMQ